jgi:hypothetical protein
MKRWFLVVVAAIAATLVLASSASAVLYYSGTLGAGSKAYSGWNYWYAEETYKGCYCSSTLYLENSSTIKGSSETGGYQYVDRDQLGIGGYLRGSVKNNESFGVTHDAYICTC